MYSIKEVVLKMVNHIYKDKVLIWLLYQCRNMAKTHGRRPKTR